MAIAFSISGEGVVWGSVVNRAGRHLGDIPLRNLGTGLKLNFISQALYLTAICLVKLTVGAMLLRIASVPFYKRLVVCLMVFVGLRVTMAITARLPLRFPADADDFQICMS